MVTGEKFFDFVEREILIPCGMVDTGFEPTKEQWSRFIDVCGKDGDKRIKVKMNENCVFTTWQCTHPLGGAGMFSTLNDYAKFAQTLLNDGVTESGKRIVGEEWVKQMRSPQTEIEETTDWGFGVRVIKKNHPYLADGSFGWSGAYGSHFWVDPENRIVAVFMKNATVDGVEEWGKKRLAYPINYETEGYYVLVNFTSAPSFPAELDRHYNITDGVIRSLIVAKAE